MYISHGELILDALTTLQENSEIFNLGDFGK
jgi:hypothetical protein